MSKSLKNTILKFLSRTVDETNLYVEMGREELEQRLLTLLGPDSNEKWWERFVGPSRYDFEKIDNDTFAIDQHLQLLGSSFIELVYWKLEIISLDNHNHYVLRLSSVLGWYGQAFKLTFIVVTVLGLFDFSFDLILFSVSIVAFWLGFKHLTVKRSTNEIVRQIQDGLMDRTESEDG